MDCSGVIKELNSVQLQQQLPAGTELGNISVIYTATLGPIFTTKILNI
jgi:hypothetical protein